MGEFFFEKGDFQISLLIFIFLFFLMLFRIFILFRIFSLLFFQFFQQACCQIPVKIAISFCFYILEKKRLASLNLTDLLGAYHLTKVIVANFKLIFDRFEVLRPSFASLVFFYSFLVPVSFLFVISGGVIFLTRGETGYFRKLIPSRRCYCY